MAFCDCVELFILNRDRESDRFRYRFHWVLYLFYWSRSLSVWKHRETMNKYCFTGIFWLLFFKTRMHSSRMRTARSLPYWGVSLGPYRDPRWTETLPDRPPRPCDPRQTPAGQRPPGHVTCGACWDRDPPEQNDWQTPVKILQNDWQTPVKILPCRNVVAGGNNPVRSTSEFVKTNSRPEFCGNHEILGKLWKIIQKYAIFTQLKPYLHVTNFSPLLF